LLLAASRAITAALAKMELDATLINRSSRISPEKSASVYECLRFTWPKNRLLGQCPKSRIFGKFTLKRVVVAYNPVSGKDNASHKAGFA